jgi:hypothetical protein
MKLPWQKDLEWTCSSPDFPVLASTGRWPPFFATSLFLPTFMLRFTNNGPPIENPVVQVDVASYEGSMSSLGSVQGWSDTQHEELESPWHTGTSRELKVVVKARDLPKAGTYIVHFSISRLEPLEPLGKQLADAVPTMPAEQREELARQLGIDPNTAQAGSRGRPVFDGWINERFRVEEVSNVLNFWLIVGTITIGLGTLLAACGGLVVAALGLVVSVANAIIAGGNGPEY